MQIRVLGSAAGGGFPQWNCNCHNCASLRAGKLNDRARTQSSIAVSNDGNNWVIINTSPDIRAQLAAFPAMQPARNKRDTVIRGVILVDAQIDHTTGLLLLREGEQLDVYCTDSVYQDLTSGFPVLNMLEHYCQTQHQAIPSDGKTAFMVNGAGQALPYLSSLPHSNE